MGVEIERKFKVRGDFRPSGSGTEIAQGYLSRDPKRTVRRRASKRRAMSRRPQGGAGRSTYSTARTTVSSSQRWSCPRLMRR